METIYEKYMALPIDKGLLCLENGDITEPYFCYPVNAKPIGFEGCILYCFLPEYGEMVFACNPESCADQNVYPLAATFEDFIRLILACGTANPVEQIVWMDKNKFEEHMASEEKTLTDEQKVAVQQLQRELSLLPIENPFEYVKSIQKDFDGSKSKVIVYLERKRLFGEETYRHICYTEIRLVRANTKANRRTK